jgi:hypothetical protein
MMSIDPFTYRLLKKCKALLKWGSRKTLSKTKIKETTLYRAKKEVNF